MTAYCDDWACPARASCRWAFGRSQVYSAMQPAELRRRERDPGAEACAEYEQDEPKPWLRPLAEQTR